MNVILLFARRKPYFAYVFFFFFFLTEKSTNEITFAISRASRPINKTGSERRSAMRQQTIVSNGGMRESSAMGIVDVIAVSDTSSSSPSMNDRRRETGGEGRGGEGKGSLPSSLV